MTKDKLFFTLKSGEEIPIIFSAKRGIKNITVRPKLLHPKQINISKPRLVSEKYVLRFLESKRDWAEKIFARAPEKHKLSFGDTISILGNEYKIVQGETLRTTTHIYNDELIVGGDETTLESRLQRFAKQIFSDFAKMAATEFADALGVKAHKITLKDTTSRWGSCAANGNIALSWRLCFAPDWVARYVIAHEMAHLKHFDHSPAFWATVGALYGTGYNRAKEWLRKFGATLHSL
jgi:predicted metal-dependent hydrolase